MSEDGYLKQLAGVFNKSHLGMAITDVDGLVVVSNAAFGKVLQPVLDSGALLSEVIVPQSGGSKNKNHLWHMIVSGKVWRGMVSFKDVGDETHDLLAIPIKNSQGMFEHILLFILGDSPDSQPETMLDTDEFQQAVDNAYDHIVITDSSGTVVYANQAVTTITGYEVNEVLGTKAGKLWGGLMDSAFYEQMWQTIGVLKKPFCGECLNRRKNGAQYYAEIRISPVLSMEREVLFYVGIERDITAVKEADLMKTEFISMAAHQLRTPLSTMKWLLELAEEEVGPEPSNLRENLDKIVVQNERMIRLVNSMLNVSRVESGKYQVNPEEVRLVELIEECVELLKERYQSLDHEIVIDCNEPELVLDIDPLIIREVIVNLLSNAMKYSASEKPIRVAVVKQEAMIRVEVVDEGIGIPEEQKYKIFHKFFRADNALKTDVDGNGLGLYLTKSLVEASGGKLEIESKENEGTKVSFTLPVGGSEKREGEVRLTADIN